MPVSQWFNEPSEWSEQNGALRFTVAPSTDFWRKTHNGAIRHNGHFRYRPIRSDFTARVKFTAGYNSLYDQAGLMLRADESTWLKCGIEYMNGLHHASAVVTRDYSDWSVTPLPEPPSALHLKIRRTGNTIEISYSPGGETFTMLRTTTLTDSPELQLGPMAAAPKGPGFEATFENLEISQP